MRSELVRAIDLPIVYDPEPEVVSARGAVLLAAERPSGDVHMPRVRTRAALAALPRPGVGRRKVLAAAGTGFGRPAGRGFGADQDRAGHGRATADEMRTGTA
ncbi:Uncharacterised protein [Mycobacteroides abscessus subsp. abscessus]|nr:Uncharacterised protein [Mycobacteroides abscessus subsp. abscessus]